MTFQPFAVNCLTCGSALRVTDPAIVGTIASCPKCHSMVQIDAPDGSKPAPPPQLAVGQSGIDSEAITEDAIASADSMATMNPTAQGDFEPIADSGRQPFAGQPPAAADGNSAVPPDQVWQSPRTAHTRQIALVAALSITGLLIAAVVFGWFVSAWQETNSSTTASISEIDAGADPIVDLESAQPVESSVLSTTEDPAANNSQEPATNEEVPLSKASSAVDDQEPSEVPVAADASQRNRVAASNASIPDGLIPSSPLEPDDKPEVQPIDPVQGDTDASEKSEGMQELPPELAKFTQILPTNESQWKPNLQAPPTIDDIELDAAATDDEFELSQTRPRELNLRGDLGIRMALASDGYPFADLLLLCGQVTTVPLEIDWVSFDLVGLATEAKIDVPTGWQTARQLIDALAAAHQCRWEEQPTLLVLTPGDERFGAVLAKVTDLADFGAETESAVTALTKFLNPDLDELPKQLQIGPSRQEQQLAALAIDSLRRMRGIEPKIPEQQIRRWATADSQTAEWPLLVGGNVGPQVDTPITIAALLRDTARLNNAVCLFNWHDLNRRGLGPETLLMPMMEGTAAETVERALGRWNIQVRQVDPQHWWIGSQATYDKLPMLAWTPELGNRQAQFLERLDVIIAGNPNKDIRFVYDSVSDRVLLKLPRYIARQLSKIVN